ncbi:MAG: hypothetical protein SGI96_14405 [Bacteroidota bacterium]|nr:hypothetical protein [Bacteroidota bacterium]
MRIINFFVFFALLGCGAAKPLTIPVACEWPGKTVFVECVNEPWMEGIVFSNVANLQIKEMQVRNTHCCLLIKFSIGETGIYEIQMMVQRLGIIPGILNVNIK